MKVVVASEGKWKPVHAQSTRVRSASTRGEAVLKLPMTMLKYNAMLVEIATLLKLVVAAKLLVESIKLYDVHGRTKNETPVSKGL